MPAETLAGPLSLSFDRMIQRRAAPAPETEVPLLVLEGLGIAYGDRQILKGLDLTIRSRGVTVLIGPAGAGKSTLLRTICCEPVPSTGAFLTGRAELCGRPLEADGAAVLVAQKPPVILLSILSFLACGLSDRSALTQPEQADIICHMLVSAGLGHLSLALDTPLLDLTSADRKCLAILRAVAADPLLLCLDEPTASLDEQAASHVLSLINIERQKRAILFVTHNQRHARAVGDDVALLAEARIVEHGDAAAFFDGPRSEIGRHFLRTGTCHLSPFGSFDEVMDGGVEPAVCAHDRAAFVPDSLGPRGFCWLVDGQLGGAARPGIVHGIDHDLAALKRVGTNLLVSLTEEVSVPPAALTRHGLEGLWFPMPDMGVPDLEAAFAFIQEIEGRIGKGDIVVYHCKAGHGRTGLMLVAHLILRGRSAQQALTMARKRKRQWVQSMVQEQFLWDLELQRALENDDRREGKQEASN